MSEEIVFIRNPRGRNEFQCPECGYLLPVDGVTECSKCGAWLQLEVSIEAPAQQ